MNNNDTEIVIYQSEDGHTKVDVRFEDETVWLTQQQLVDLFQTSKSNVSEHIKHIFEEGELEEKQVVRSKLFGNSEQLHPMANHIIQITTIWI